VTRRTHPRDLPWSAAAFERRYRDETDPWRFATSAYERDRYRITLRALRRRRYRAAFEPGCSIGELTALLAARCDSLNACDIAPSAVDRARRRCAGMDNVEILCAGVTEGLPRHAVDLIVFSEIGYYFSPVELALMASQLAARLVSGGEFVAVHWLGHSADHRLHGEEVHRILHRQLHPRLRWDGGGAEPGFRIDTWLRP
jgi:SAM-dependent methyltransferase